jgi:hypothetical protein
VFARLIAETVRTFHASLLLLSFRWSAVCLFPLDTGGAIRSFALAGLLLPLEIIAAVLVPPSFSSGVALNPFNILVELIRYSVEWTAFAVTLFYVCQMIDRKKEWTAAVSVLNWTKPAQLTLITLVLALGAVGVIPSAYGEETLIITFLCLIVFNGMVLYHTLRIDTWMAVGLTGLWFFLQMLNGQFALAVMRTVV